MSFLRHILVLFSDGLFMYSLVDASMALLDLFERGGDLELEWGEVSLMFSLDELTLLERLLVT